LPDHCTSSARAANADSRLDAAAQVLISPTIWRSRMVIRGVRGGGGEEGVNGVALPKPRAFGR